MVVLSVVLSVLSTVPLLLQLLQAPVVAVSARRWQPSPGEGSGCRGALSSGASSRSSRSSASWRGRAGGGRGGQGRPQPGLKTCRVQAHLWRRHTDRLNRGDEVQRVKALTFYMCDRWAFRGFTHPETCLDWKRYIHVLIVCMRLFSSPFSLSMSSSWQPDASPDSSSMVPCSCFSTSCCPWENKGGTELVFADVGSTVS